MLSAWKTVLSERLSNDKVTNNTIKYKDYETTIFTFLYCNDDIVRFCTGVAKCSIEHAQDTNFSSNKKSHYHAEGRSDMVGLF